MTLKVKVPLAWFGAGRLIHHAAVVCGGGRVTYAGPSAAAPPADELLEVDGFLMPGVADRHVHIRLADPGAVLLGGVTALLPVFARDILHCGPVGLGVLRSAPAAGAALTAVALARWPLQRRAGNTMFGAVAVFGVATIVFGLSTSFTVSLIALVVLGASDMVSVIIRSTLVQLAAPDAMRGRVSAVNMLFVGASNELGEFESGFTAA